MIGWFQAWNMLNFCISGLVKQNPVHLAYNMIFVN